MSLFSRLDRIRNREREDNEGGMFAVSDLGARDDEKPLAAQAVPPAAASPQAPASSSPSSPLRTSEEVAAEEEANQPRRFSMPASLNARVPAESEPSADKDDAELNAPEAVVPQAVAPQAVAPHAAAPEVLGEADEDEDVTQEDNEGQSAPSAIFGSAPVTVPTPDEPPAQATMPAVSQVPTSDELPAPRTASSSVPAPSATPTPSGSSGEAPRSPFDRLMAARQAKAEAASAPEPPAAPERPRMEEVPAPPAASAPATPTSAAPASPRVVPVPAATSRFQPVAPLDESTLDSPLDVASGEVAPIEAKPVIPATPTPSATMSNYSSPRQDDERAAIEPDSASEGGFPGNRFSARFAARESLDRKLASVESPPPPAEREMTRTGAEMTRVEEDPNLSERESKLRTLFRHKHLIFDSVFGAIDPRVLQNPTRETIRPIIERAVEGSLREFNLGIEGAERNWLVDEFVRETTDIGPLVPLLDDPGVNKIIVTGANDVAIEKLGRVERTGISFRDDDHLLALVRRIAEMTGGRIDAKVPLLDRPLPDGARIRAKVPPLAPQPTLTIEKSTGNPFNALKRANAERVRDESLPYNQLRERIQLRLLREFEGNTAAMGNQERLRAQVEEMINQVIIEERVAVTRAERAALVMDLLNEIVGLGPIEPLLNDPEVDEVMVNGPYQIYVERKGKLEISSQRFRDNAHVLQVIDRIVAPLGRRVDEKSPMVDGRLRDGSRFNAIIPPLALAGPTMTIRKFARDPFTMTDLINFGSLTREAAQFLQAAVEGRLNIVVSGGTGSGKTTTLNVLSSFIPSSERIVTIEDAAELQLRQEHVVRLETRPPNIEGVGEIAIRDLVRNSLRMRPDRIVVGECRGGEALDMLQAMNTGHDGSLTTAHSNGPRDTLKRMETMVMMAGFDLPVKAIREQIAMAVQLVVHQERMRDGKRRVTAVTEIVGMEGDVITMQDLYRFEQERVDEDGRIHGSLAPTGLRPKHWDTMIDNGVELSMELFHPRNMMEGGGMRGRLSDHRSGTR